jgi:hypothetical protein
MPTTTNFGWTTPADTDLVKDGAAAIRTLGNGVDTSLVDLKGGTTGQILSKNSNTDLDYTWITPNVGDITEVQAGTGISVASGTGPIPVVTNTVATAFDAKGDLIVGTGADTFAKLGVGTNGYTIVADSGESVGMRWAAPAAASLTSGYAETVTSQGTTSTSFTDLATVTAVTVTTGTKALVIYGGQVQPGSAGYISVAISGASSVAASNDNSVVFAGTEAYQTRAIVFSGLTAGSNTFTEKFRANTGTADFLRRGITVIDLGS